MNLDQAVKDLNESLNKGKGDEGVAPAVQTEEGRRGLIATLAKGLSDASTALVKMMNPGKDEGMGGGKGPVGVAKNDTEKETTGPDGKDLVVAGDGKDEDAPDSGDGKKKKKAELPKEKEHGGDGMAKDAQAAGADEKDSPDKGKGWGKSADLDEIEPLTKAELAAYLVVALEKSEARITVLESKIDRFAEAFVTLMAPMAQAQSEMLKSLTDDASTRTAPRVVSPGVIGAPPKKGDEAVSKSGPGDEKVLGDLSRGDDVSSVRDRLVKAVQDEKVAPGVLRGYEVRGIRALDGIDPEVAKAYALPIPGNDKK